MKPEEILLTIITVLITIIGYFVKKTFDKTETIGTDVAEMKPKLEILWRDFATSAHSPRQLNKKGQDILDTSGIKEIINEKKDDLLRIIRERNTNNPYDAEQVITDVVSKLPEHCPDTIDRLKQGAFQSGVDINTVLYVGSIYLRNSIFPDLGYSLEDLDKPKT